MKKVIALVLTLAMMMTVGMSALAMTGQVIPAAVKVFTQPDPSSGYTYISNSTSVTDVTVYSKVTRGDLQKSFYYIQCGNVKGWVLENEIRIIASDEWFVHPSFSGVNVMSQPGLPHTNVIGTLSGWAKVIGTATYTDPTYGAVYNFYKVAYNYNTTTNSYSYGYVLQNQVTAQ